MPPSCSATLMILCFTAILTCKGLANDGSKETRLPSGPHHNDRLSVLYLLRMKRFDFHIFECARCHPAIECHSDSYCYQKFGNDYKCMFECCELKCVHKSGDQQRLSSNDGHESEDDD